MIPYGLWISKRVLVQGCMKFRSSFKNCVSFSEISNFQVKFVPLWSNRRKNCVLKIIVFYLNSRYIIGVSGNVSPFQVKYQIKKIQRRFFIPRMINISEPLSRPKKLCYTFSGWNNSYFTSYCYLIDLCFLWKKELKVWSQITSP